MGLILPQEVEVTWVGKTITAYKAKGYNGVWKQKVKINVEDLMPYSNIKINCICDYCNNEYSITMAHYTDRVLNGNGLCCCKKCQHIELSETVKSKYGVDNISKLESIKKQKAETQFKNYGYSYNLQNPNIKNKVIKSLINKWGVKYPMQSPLFKEKMVELYNADNPMKIEEIKNKIQQTNILKYGNISPMSSKDVQEKTKKTMYKNGTVATSSQQRAIYDVYKVNFSQAELNYPIGKSYSGDIVIDNLDIEIDYGGHNLTVKKGQISQEEFDYKQMIRDKIVKSEGYKIVRIIADKTRAIPSDSKLLEILDYARNFFKDNPERSWIEFDIDNSTVRNALCKNNPEHYDFGELRKLPRKTA